MKSSLDPSCGGFVPQRLTRKAEGCCSRPLLRPHRDRSIARNEIAKSVDRMNEKAGGFLEIGLIGCSP